LAAAVKKSAVDPVRLPISADQRDKFSRICADTKAAFQDVFDLVLIHNERIVRGRQPRATLNGPIAMFSVAAWERFIADVGELSQARHGKTFQAPGKVLGRGAYLGPGKNGAPAVKILSAASAGTIPADWRIRLPQSGQGKRLSFGTARRGLDPDLVDITDWWITMRNGIAHRSLPRVLEWLYTDPKVQEPAINTTLARIALTLFLQLADQSIRALTDAAQFEGPDELWLPGDWLAGKLRPVRGVKSPSQLTLWVGPSLAAPKPQRD
jgi:hypothetical protein